MKAKREPRTSIIIHLLNTLKNIWRNSLIGNLDSIIIDNRVNWGGKKIIRTMIWMVMKFGWNRWSRFGWWREVERKERVSTGGKRGKVRGVKLDAVEARGGQVGVPICDSTQQEGRGGPAHRVARSFARHCRATLTFCPSAPPAIFLSWPESLVHRVNLIILHPSVCVDGNEWVRPWRPWPRENTRCLRSERKRQRFFPAIISSGIVRIVGNLCNRSLESYKNTLQECMLTWLK